MDIYCRLVNLCQSLLVRHYSPCCFLSHHVTKLIIAKIYLQMFPIFSLWIKYGFTRFVNHCIKVLFILILHSIQTFIWKLSCKVCKSNKRSSINWPIKCYIFAIVTCCTYRHISTQPSLMRATKKCCLVGESFRAARGNSHEWPGTYFDSRRLLTATFCTRGLIFDGMKHGTGKQFEEQSRYTKGYMGEKHVKEEAEGPPCPELVLD